MQALDRLASLALVAPARQSVGPGYLAGSSFRPDAATISPDEVALKIENVASSKAFASEGADE